MKLVRMFGRYIFVTIRLRDARTYGCHCILFFIIAVYVTLVHMVFPPVWGSPQLTTLYTLLKKLLPVFTLTVTYNHFDTHETPHHDMIFNHCIDRLPYRYICIADP